jgi:SAM-dependent methyltransferase
MIGAKAGQSALVMGSADVALAAEVARVTGLNGRTVIAAQGGDAGRRLETAAANAGALVEFEDTALGALPFDADGFDVVAVVVDWVGLGDADRTRFTTEAVRVVRPGGRVLILIKAARHGVLGRLRMPEVSAEDVDGACRRLTAAGARAVRLLAKAEGVAYVEAVKPLAT